MGTSGAIRWALCDRRAKRNVCARGDGHQRRTSVDFRRLHGPPSCSEVATAGGARAYYCFVDATTEWVTLRHRC